MTLHEYCREGPGVPAPVPAAGGGGAATPTTTVLALPAVTLDLELARKAVSDFHHFAVSTKQIAINANLVALKGPMLSGVYPSIGNAAIDRFARSNDMANDTVELLNFTTTGGAITASQKVEVVDVRKTTKLIEAALLKLNSLMLVSVATPVSPELRQENRVGKGMYVDGQSEYELTYDTVLSYLLLLQRVPPGGDASGLRNVLNNWEAALVRRTDPGRGNRSTIGHALIQGYENFEAQLQNWSLTARRATAEEDSGEEEKAKDELKKLKQQLQAANARLDNLDRDRGGGRGTRGRQTGAGKRGPLTRR